MCSVSSGSTQGYGSNKQISFAGSMSQGMGGGGSAGGAATVLGAAPALAANGTVLGSYNAPRAGQPGTGSPNTGYFGPYQFAQRQKF